MNETARVPTDTLSAAREQLEMGVSEEALEDIGYPVSQDGQPVIGLPTSDNQPHPYKIDERTRELGLEGVKTAREALRRAGVDKAS